MIEISGQESKIEAFIELMRPYGIVELVRTGRIAMVRGGKHYDEQPQGRGRYPTSKTRPSHPRVVRVISPTHYSQLTTHLRMPSPMPAKIYYDNDADLSRPQRQDDRHPRLRRQGHAQAQNLRDSGCTVIIGQRPGGPNYDLAVKHGFKPVSAEDATKQADIVNILLPDEVQGDIYRTARSSRT